MFTTLITKKCGACKEEVDVARFTKNNASKDRLQSVCKSCDKFRQAVRRIEKAVETREYSLNYQRNRRKDPEYRIQMLLNASKQRALKKNREHTLTLKEIKELWPVDNKCPVFGFNLEWNNEGFRETSPSLDRIDSSKGYTKDNVQVISWKANRIKAYATIEELETVLKYMKEKE
jgi:hypothetical protein